MTSSLDYYLLFFSMFSMRSRSQLGIISPLRVMVIAQMPPKQHLLLISDNLLRVDKHLYCTCHAENYCESHEPCCCRFATLFVAVLQRQMSISDVYSA